MTTNHCSDERSAHLMLGVASSQLHLANEYGVAYKGMAQFSLKATLFV